MLKEPAGASWAAEVQEWILSLQGAFKLDLIITLIDFFK